MKLSTILNAALATCLCSPSALAYTFSSQVTIDQFQDANLNLNTGTVVIGDTAGSQLAFDNNEILARGASGTSRLYLQNNGGPTRIGGTSGIELEGNEVRYLDDWAELIVDGDTVILMHRPTPSEMIITMDADKINVNSTMYVDDGIYLGNMTAGSYNPACISHGWLVKCASSQQFKRDVVGIRSGLELLLALRPVRFTWKAGGERDLGFIAEDAAKVIPELAIRDEDGSISGFNYQHYTAIVTRAVQEQQADLIDLRERFDSQGRQLDSLKAELNLHEEQARLQLEQSSRQQTELEALRAEVQALTQAVARLSAPPPAADQ